MSAANALLILLFSLVGTAQEQPASIGGPIFGFVQDEKGETIRPLLGIVGASVLGPRLDLPSGILKAVLSPKQDYALATRAEDFQPVIIKLDNSNPILLPLPDAPPNVSLIAISPTGAAAALYYGDSRRMVILGELPANPIDVYEFDTALLSGEIAGIAVSDDARFTLLNIIDGENYTLWIVDRNGYVSPVSGGRPSLLRFLANRHDALIADDAAQEVFLLTRLDDNPVRLPGTVFVETSGPFAAIAASNDGRMIFVAQRGSENITILDLESQTQLTVPCRCNPTEFFPLNSNSVFRLNGLSDGPITVLDASSGEPRIVVIPPDPGVPLP
jgi:hypothetical protein